MDHGPCNQTLDHGPCCQTLELLMEDQLNENMSTFVLVQGESDGSKSVCPKESNGNYDGGDCDDGNDHDENCYIP